MLGEIIRENGSSTVTFSTINLGAAQGSGSPYWNNDSSDGLNMNVGYYLTNTGGFAGSGLTTNQPNRYLAGSNGTQDSPASFGLVRSANPLSIMLLRVTTGAIDTFGWYDASTTTTASAMASEQPIWIGNSSSLASSYNVPQPLNIPNGTDYGFYLSQTVGSTLYTYFSNAALDSAPGDPVNHQHLTLFDNSNGPADLYYLSVEDWGINHYIEGLGDYNDFIVKLDATSVPEPSVLALGGIALLGLGRFRRSPPPQNTRQPQPS